MKWRSWAMAMAMEKTKMARETGVGVDALFGCIPMH